MSQSIRTAFLACLALLLPRVATAQWSINIYADESHYASVTLPTVPPRSGAPISGTITFGELTEEVTAQRRGGDVWIGLAGGTIVIQGGGFPFGGGTWYGINPQGRREGFGVWFPGD